MNKMGIYVMIGAIVAFLVVLYVNKGAAQFKVPAKEFQEKLGKNKSAQLIDIRTPGEFQSGHLKGSRNIDFYGANFKQQIATLKKDKPVFLYCRSGGRSGRAAQMLKQMGFTKIYDLKGGIMSWSSEGLSTTR